MVAGRRTAALDHVCEIAGGKLSRLERADDLESRRIAEAHQDALRIASRSRRQHARLSFRDRAVIDDPVRSYGTLRLVSSCVEIARPVPIWHRARVLILVIDDDRAIGELIRDVLGDEGYDVSLVDDLESAAADVNPDLVITDLVGLHHYDTDAARVVVARVSERYPGIPLIVCTGHEQALREASRLGAKAAVRKPFTLEALVKTVATVIAH